MLARAAGDSPSFVKLPVNHATTASGLNHHDYHSHTNKPKRGYAHLPRSRQCTIHHCDALLGQTLRYLLASATPPI